MYLSNFVYTLKELLIENGITQSELAERLNTEPSTISKYLKEKQYPDIEMAVKIADYFGCSLDFLFLLKDRKSNEHFHECPPFNERFLYLLDSFHISRYKLQQKTNISKSAMYYWQIGKTNPTMDSIIKLAKYFDCSIDFILGRVDFD